MTFVHSWYALFKRRATRTKDAATQMRRGAGQKDLRKCLGPFDLIMLGIGGIIGAGVFVLTGVAANELAGPAVVLSYSIAAFAALVSALCYTEFVVDLPTAGGAFNYISLVFGEFAAWLVACNLIMEYTLSAAAVARGFSSYLATLAGLDPTFFVLKVSVLNLDFLAVGLIALLTGILCYGTKESARFNTVVTMVNLGVIVFVVCAGMPYASGTNFKPFTPYGAHGVFAAASVVFFSFIGFDTVATTAEEVKNPAVDLPIGIVGSLVVCGFLYALMCVVICLMVPYDQIDVNAPFSEAFHTILTNSGANASLSKKIFLNVAQRIVSVGALTGIVTSLLVPLLGQARIYVVLGREQLLPAFFSAIHKKQETPIYATIFTGCTAGLLALLVDINALAELVSIGTLFVFYLVSAGVLARRFYVPGSHDVWPLLLRMGAMLVLNIAFTISFRLRAPVAVIVVMALLWLVSACTLYTLPVMWRPKKFAVPLSPLTPALGMFVTLHLVGSLGWKAYARFGGWIVVSAVFYVLYSMHHAEAKEAREAHTLVTTNSSHLPPPSGPDGGQREVEMSQQQQPGDAADEGDALWQDDSSDDSHRGTLLNGLGDTGRSDDPKHLLTDDEDEQLPPGAPSDQSPVEIPGSRVAWEAAHRDSFEAAHLDSLDGNAQQLTGGRQNAAASRGLLSRPGQSEQP